MNNINRILILFLFVLFLSFVGLWQYVQSASFANLLSKVATRYGQEFLSADVKFERINFKLYPPGVEVVNLNINTIANDDLVIASSQLGISFSPLDIFKTDLVIDRVYLYDALVGIKTNNYKTTSKASDANVEELHLQKTLNSYLDKLPFVLKNIELAKVDLRIDQKEIILSKIDIHIEESKLGLMVSARNFNLNQFEIKNEVIDQVEISAEIVNENLHILDLIIEKEMNKLVLKGQVNNFLNLEKSTADLSVEFNGIVKDIHKYVDLTSIGSLEEGLLKINSKIIGNTKTWKSEIDIDLHDFKTSFLDGDGLRINANVNNERVVVEKFEINHKRGSLIGKKSFEFLNLKTMKFVEENIEAHASNFELKNGLKYLKDVLGIINSRLSGGVRFRLGESDFQFDLEDDFKLTQFKLEVTEDSAILDIPNLQLNKSSFLIKGNDVFIKTNVRGENIDLQLDGSVIGGEVAFKAQNGRIDLKKLGKIAGFTIEGSGDVDIDVLVNKENNYLRINNNLNNFSFDGYFQQKLNSQFEIDFNKNHLYVRKINAQTGNTKTNGDLKLSFNDMGIEAVVEQKNIYMNDVKLMFPQYLQAIDWLESDVIYGDWSLKAIVSGKLSLNELNAELKFSGLNNLIYEESFDLIEMSASLRNSKFTISECKFSKPSGYMNLGVRYNFIDEKVTTWGNIVHIPLFEINNYQKIPSTLQGKLNGHFRGNIHKGQIDISTEVAVSDSHAQGKKVSDSLLKFDIKDDIISYNVALLGDAVASKGSIHIGKSSNELSTIDFQLNSDDINELLALLAVVDIYKTGIEGRIKASGNIGFVLNQWKKFDANLKIHHVMLNKNDIKLDYTNKENDQIVVSKGNIELWDLELRGSKIYLISKGSGNLSEKYDIQTRARIDASLLEIFNLVFSKVSGTILASIHNYKTIFTEDYEAKLVSNNLEMSSDHFPVSVSKGDLLVNYKNQKLVLNKLSAQLNTGEFFADGEVDFSRVLPALNIRYEFRNAGFPIMKKSFLSFSGKGAIAGRTFPYSLGGDFNILKFNFVNEITDFIGGEKIATADIDFLPTDKSRAINQLINLNINVATTEPLRITNSMSNLGFVGNLSISGGERDPRVAGKISLAPMKNEIFFKNNKFLITKGNVFFYERNKISNPELDFMATSTINKHNITISVLGPVKQFKMDLSSDPVLAQNDILSLVAFGFTEDVSTNLSDQEKESMTRAGVGSIIFDRFKINETLKNEFGLQVNLGTEIQQQEMSLLSRRNAEGTDALGRTRSATTIEIKKQISDAIDLSVTSTVGTSIGQRQSMNLNYNINKNLSLEGVYENVTDIQTGDLSTESTSLGADVKLRWSFK
jgi:translocation and assembly module TamB